MKSLARKVLPLVAAAGICGGCALSNYRAPVVPPVASSFNYTAAPMNLHLRKTRLGTKMGRSTASSILGLLSFGDATIAAAARAGGITTIHHADTELLNVLGIYARHTTIVYGE